MHDENKALASGFFNVPDNEIETRHGIKESCLFVFTLHDMSLVRRFDPKRLTYSILWTIPTGAIWGEVSQGHNDMLTAVGFEPVPNTNALPTAPHKGYNQQK